MSICLLTCNSVFHHWETYADCTSFFVLQIFNWLRIGIVHYNLFWSRIPTIDCLIYFASSYIKVMEHVFGRVSTAGRSEYHKFDWLDFRGE